MTTPFDRAGAYRYRVGAAEVVVLADGYRRFSLPDGLVTNAARDAVNRALTEAGMPADEMTIHFNPVIVRTGDRTVLIDTGNGPAARQSGSTAGLLIESLAEADISPDAIDTVVISHFHGDHVNGLLSADGAPTFAGADVRVPSPEWRFWIDEGPPDSAQQRVHDTAQSARRIFAPLHDRVTQYAGEDELAPGLNRLLKNLRLDRYLRT